MSTPPERPSLSKHESKKLVQQYALLGVELLKVASRRKAITDEMDEICKKLGLTHAEIEGRFQHGSR